MTQLIIPDSPAAVVVVGLVATASVMIIVRMSYLLWKMILAIKLAGGLNTPQQQALYNFTSKEIGLVSGYIAAGVMACYYAWDGIQNAQVGSHLIWIFAIGVIGALIGLVAIVPEQWLVSPFTFSAGLILFCNACCVGGCAWYLSDAAQHNNIQNIKPIVWIIQCDSVFHAVVCYLGGYHKRRVWRLIVLTVLVCATQIASITQFEAGGLYRLSTWEFITLYTSGYIEYIRGWLVIELFVDVEMSVAEFGQVTNNDQSSISPGDKTFIHSKYDTSDSVSDDIEMQARIEEKRERYSGGNVPLVILDMIRQARSESIIYEKPENEFIFPIIIASIDHNVPRVWSSYHKLWQWTATDISTVLRRARAAKSPGWKKRCGMDLIQFVGPANIVRMLYLAADLESISMLVKYIEPVDLDVIDRSDWLAKDGKKIIQDEISAYSVTISRSSSLSDIQNAYAVINNNQQSN